MASCHIRPFARMPGADKSADANTSVGVVRLPAPCFAGSTPLESASGQRRSVRKLSPEPLTLAEVSQLFWAVQGFTASDS